MWQKTNRQKMEWLTVPLFDSCNLKTVWKLDTCYLSITKQKISVFTKNGNSTNLFQITTLRSSGITNFIHHSPHRWFLLYWNKNNACKYWIQSVSKKGKTSLPYIYTVLHMVFLLYTFFVENTVYAQPHNLSRNVQLMQKTA